MAHLDVRPFGPPRLRARVRTSVLPAALTCGPLEFFRRICGDGRERGSLLLESADRGAPAGTRSVVVPGAPIRLVLRGEQALFQPLDPRGEQVLEVLAECLTATARADGMLCVHFPGRPADPALPDEDRLRAPSSLDAVRLLAGLVGDEPGTAARPPGVYGAFSYEIVDRFETLPPRRPDPFDEPDASLVLALDAVVFEHLRGAVRVTTRALPGETETEADARHTAVLKAVAGPAPEPDPPVGGGGGGDLDQKAAEADLSEADFRAAVQAFLSHIRAGEIFQGVLSRGFSMTSPASPLAVYRALRRLNPSPYMFYYDLGDGVLLGASPETCLKVEAGEMELRPIAGTAPRGLRPDGTLDDERDMRLAVGLLLDRKEQSEHAMLVDLARNDVARVCVPGTRRIVAPLSIEKYSHVQHLVTRVRGRLRPGLDALHAYRASANMGTLTGAPKLRAMELIRETEPCARGFYGGAVGYLLQDGSFDSCIVIRSLRFRGGRYLARAGAGIVADSVPERELEEVGHKARSARLAVALAERSEA